MNGKLFMKDAASGLAFVTGELERLDPELRKPLSGVTYARDVEIISGDYGWVQVISKYNVNYGVAGGVNNGMGGIANAISRIQADLSKDSIKTKLFQSSMSVKLIDLKYDAVTGRNIEEMLSDGVRLYYSKFLDQAVYKGFEENGTTGLVNDPEVVSSLVQTGEASSTEWKKKTPVEILDDINEAIEEAWEAAEFDPEAMPNHILIDPKNYAFLVKTPLSIAGVMGAESILTYLLKNNLAQSHNVNLNIFPCRHCFSAGAGSKNRMVIYKNDKRFVDFLIPIDLTREASGINYTDWSIDTLFVSLVGQIRLHYTQPIIYKDGI